MPSKTEEYLALAQRTANGLTRYWESWTDYLTTASRLYKYPFADQLMIYAQRPDATACADFDIWNNRMNRTDWLKMMKSRVEITTYTSYERAIVHKIVQYFEPIHCRIWNSIPNTSKTSTSMSWIVALRQTPSFTITPTSANACSTLFKSA